MWIIFGYYFLATILPIQAIMGKVYPLFSGALIIMVVGILGVMLLAPFACIPIRGGIMNSISFIMDWRKSR